MARKELLKGLMTAPSPASTGDGTGSAELPAGNRGPARRPGGAVGAVSRSVADLRARAVVEVDPRMVDGAGLRDRLDAEDPDLPALVASIREHGQQVPVLLRVNPNYPERYEVVYGRRRVAALRAAGLPVKALIRDLDDRALVMAQGQENSHRKDLTFIERVNFARQMRDGGYDRTAIGAALAVDKTGVSKLLAVADRVPVALVQAIGAAPSFGRDRWLTLATAIAGRDEADLVAAARGEGSDARFLAVARHVAERRDAPKAARTIPGPDGPIGRIRMTGGRAEITVEDARFGEWVGSRLGELHDAWSSDVAD